MKNLNLKSFLLAGVLLGLSTSAFATYPDCRAAGGGFFSCFYKAAMNDQIAAPTGGTGSTTPVLKFSEAQLKKSFAKNNKRCSGVAVDKQVGCVNKSN